MVDTAEDLGAFQEWLRSITEKRRAGKTLEEVLAEFRGFTWHGKPISELIFPTTLREVAERELFHLDTIRSLLRPEARGLEGNVAWIVREYLAAGDNTAQGAAAAAAPAGKATSPALSLSVAPPPNTAAAPDGSGAGDQGEAQASSGGRSRTPAESLADGLHQPIAADRLPGLTHDKAPTAPGTQSGSGPTVTDPSETPTQSRTGLASPATTPGPSATPPGPSATPTPAADRPSQASARGGPAAGPAVEPVDDELARLVFSADLTFPPGDVAQVSATRPAHGPIVVTWPEDAGGPAAPVRLWRLLANDDYPPYTSEAVFVAQGQAPPATQTFEAARCLAPTASADDPFPLTAIRRHYALLAYDGVTPEAAAAAEPRLVAEGCVEGDPLRHVEIRAEPGAIVGSWTATPGVVEVAVHRALLREARKVELPGWRLGPDGLVGEPSGHSGPTGEAVLIGPSSFVDRSVQPGRDYVYALIPYSEDPVSHQPQPLPAWKAPHPVSLPASLKPVTDLRQRDVRPPDQRDGPLPLSPGLTELGNGRATVALEWTAPAGGGDIRLYRTLSLPALDRPEGQVVAVENLEQRGLPPGDQLHDPVTEDLQRPGLMWTTAEWPGRGYGTELAEWVGVGVAYFTPVVVSDKTAFVGPSLQVVRPPHVRHARFTERVSRQLVTFAWPDGAHDVRIGICDRDGQPTFPPDGTLVTSEEYDVHGAMEVPLSWPDPLQLVLQATMTVQKVQLPGPVSDPPFYYPGLVVVAYRLELENTVVRATLTPDLTTYRKYEFALATHSRILPLTARDQAFGEPVQLALGRIAGADGYLRTVGVNGFSGRPGPDPVTLEFAVQGLTGWMRLVLVPRDVGNSCLKRDQTLALIDPPIHQLRLG